jgi:hypothetical protein
MVPGLAILALPLAGSLSVLLYRRNSSEAEPRPGTGFRLGATTGVIGCVVFVGLKTLSIVAKHAESSLRADAIEAVQRAGSLYSDSQVREMVELLKSPEGLAFYLLLTALVMCVLFVLLSGLGGAISAALLRRKLPPE